MRPACPALWPGTAVRADRSVDPAGYPGFAIRTDDKRREAFVVTYLEPMARFDERFGLDLGAEPGPRRLLELGRDEGSMASSGLPVMLDRPGGQIGLTLRLPLYRSSAARAAGQSGAVRRRCARPRTAYALDPSGRPPVVRR
jgi:two-component system sensor histidine kinase/response regulator